MARFEEQTAGTAQIIQQVRVIRAFRQRGTQISDRFLVLTRLDLRYSQCFVGMNAIKMWNSFGSESRASNA